MKRFSKKHILLVGIVLFFGLLALLFIIQVRALSNGFTAYALERGEVEHIVTASGHISSAGTLDVYSTVNGVVTDILVQNDQVIGIDEPLFTVKSTASPQEKAAAKASYLSAIDDYNAAEQNKILYQAQLEQARENVINEVVGQEDFRDQLGTTQLERDAINSADWSTRKLFENAEKKYLDATQTLAAKSQNIAAKKAAYDATLDQTVTSTVAGTVANISPKIGDEVYALANTKAQPVLTLSNFDTYTVEVNISENDIYRIELGQNANVTIESFPDRTFTGTVSKIDSIGTVENGLVTYKIQVELLGLDMRMRAGMTADVEIITDDVQDALLIPNEAISEINNQKVVYIQANTPSGYDRKNITIGLKGEEFSEVTSGLDGSETLLDPLEISISIRE